jgi:NTP pyrophosphatase (non-canonical NTP hydrolase)
MTKYTETINQLLTFNDERDWEQFHDSRNLALALFLWKKDSESEKVDPEKLKEELADVLSYAFMLAEKHNLDIFDIVQEKIKINAKKYPVEKAKGTAKKYTEL